MLTLETVEAALAVAALSTTVTLSSAFDVPRALIQQRSKTLYKLLSCPYCFAHWLAPLGAVYAGYRGLTGIVVGTFVIVALAALICGLINHLLMFYQKRVDQLEQTEEVLIEQNEELRATLKEIADG